ncbi:MAG: ATP-binding protein [Desulfovibrionales bacterium]|nr:ATP-binding protein [Desulfovibrionales bacterium]
MANKKANMRVGENFSPLSKTDTTGDCGAGTAQIVTEAESSSRLLELQKELDAAQQEIALLREVICAMPARITVMDSAQSVVYGEKNDDTQWRPVDDSESQALVCAAHKIKNCRDCAFRRVVASGESQRVTETSTESGAYREVNLIPLKSSEHSGLIVQCAYDVTKDRERSRELRAAKDAAEAAGQAKTDFLATMSHEIRTPMNGLLGMLDLALDTELDGEQREYLEAVENSAESLLVLINHILDFSKIEAGVIEIDPQAFRLRKKLSALRTMFFHRAEERCLNFRVIIPDDVPEVLVGDFPRIRQVLVNLLDNALKYTDSGTIEVQVELLEKSADDALVRFSVADTGIGIRAEHKELIFEKFVQSDSSVSRKHQGAGLGLSICRKLVELLGGTLEVESAAGSGTTFSFALPLGLSMLDEQGHPVHSSEAISPASRFGYTKRALIVDDNDVNLKYMQLFLEKHGFTVGIATNGIEALESLQKDYYDIVLMDIAMPHMDGLEATRTIRESTSLRVSPDVPVIAMTAHALKGDREVFLANGMNEYVGKPINPDNLLRIMHTLLQKKARESA